MKLNKECIRDLLLFIEEKCVYYEDSQYGVRVKNVSYNEICEDKKFQKYDKDVIRYTISKMLEGQYIQGETYPVNDFATFDIVNISGLTLQGHELLDNIRPEKVWAHTKKVLEKVSDFSLNVMTQVASRTMASYAISLMDIPDKLHL